MIKAVIFDLDGVIVDTAHYHFLAWKRLASELKISFGTEDNEKLKGVSRSKSLEIILDLGGVVVNEVEKEQLSNKKNAWFVEYLTQLTPAEIYPGVSDLIKTFRSNGFKIALASSSKNAMTVLRLLQIENQFDVIVDGNMILNAKPDPEIFLSASTRLGIAPPHCLVFEDAEAGVEAARAAGMKCIGVGTTEYLSKADLIVLRTGDFNLEMLNDLN